MVVSIGLFCALIYQNKLTRRAANAAQASADALKDIERPWLLLTTMDRYGDTIRLPDGSDKSVFGVCLKFKNFGKTPAFIDTIKGGAEIIESIDIKLTPDYRPPYACADELILAPKQESGNIIFVMPRKLGDDEFQKLINGNRFLIAFGEIKYTDAFGGEDFRHITRFCYRYTFGTRDVPGGFHFTFGPKEFNEYT